MTQEFREWDYVIYCLLIYSGTIKLVRIHIKQRVSGINCAAARQWINRDTSQNRLARYLSPVVEYT